MIEIENFVSFLQSDLRQVDYLYLSVLFMSFLLGPYAAYNLWKINNKGRKTTIFLLLILLIYEIYILKFYPVSILFMIHRTGSIIFYFIQCVILFSPLIKSVCVSPKIQKSKINSFYNFISQLKPTEKVTIVISFLALIVSITSILISNFYKPDKLIVSVADIQLSSDSLLVPVIFINSGKVNAVVTEANISFSQESLFSRSYWGENSEWFWSCNSKKSASGEIILKPGEMFLLKISVPSKIEIDDLASANENLLIAIVTKSIDSNGILHLKHNILGKVQLDDQQIVKYTKNSDITIEVESKNKTNYTVRDKNYSSRFRLQ